MSEQNAVEIRTAAEWTDWLLKETCADSDTTAELLFGTTPPEKTRQTIHVLELMLSTIESVFHQMEARLSDTEFLLLDEIRSERFSDQMFACLYRKQVLALLMTTMNQKAENLVTRATDKLITFIATFDYDKIQRRKKSMDSHRELLMMREMVMRAPLEKKIGGFRNRCKSILAKYSGMEKHQIQSVDAIVDICSQCSDLSAIVDNVQLPDLVPALKEFRSLKIPLYPPTPG